MNSTSYTIVSAAALVCLPCFAIAQPFAVEWSTLSGGGATADTAGSYALGASLGQATAAIGSAGAYQLGAGFWQGETSGPVCYANCDGSTAAPVLNALDFGCFLTKFAASASYANCDGSTAAPVLNALDFGCFLTKFAAGCS